MGDCYIFNKRQFIEQMQKVIKDDQAVIISTIKQGMMSGASKKKLKGFHVGFTNDCFKNPEDIRDLMKSFSAGLILLNPDDQSESVKKLIKDEE